MAQPPLSSEVALAKYFVSWLQEQHWDVYQEVQLRPYGPRADIVAIFLPVVWILEVKQQPGFRVIEQAYEWLPHAHQVSVAVPWISHHRHRSSSFEAIVMRKFGLGLLVLEHSSNVREHVRPTFNRHAKTDWIRNLTPQQKLFAPAGNSANLRWTPFVETRTQVTAYVTTHPGCTPKELFANIKTHYHGPTAAQHNILRYIERGIIKTVRIVRSGKELRLYPVDQPFPVKL